MVTVSLLSLLIKTFLVTDVPVPEPVPPPVPAPAPDVSAANASEPLLRYTATAKASAAPAFLFFLRGVPPPENFRTHKIDSFHPSIPACDFDFLHFQSPNRMIGYLFSTNISPSPAKSKKYYHLPRAHFCAKKRRFK
jgi:hypothetical protein